MSEIPALSEAEEQEIVALSDEEGWVSAKNIEAERALWQEAASRAPDGNQLDPHRYLEL